MNDDKNMTVSGDCDSVREDFSALLDGELSNEEREAVESHLSGCSECLRALDEIQRVDGLYGALPEVDAPDNLEDAVREALLPRTNPRGWLRRPSRAILAQAAVALVVVGGLWTIVSNNIREVEAPLRMARLDSGVDTAAESAAAEKSDANEEAVQTRTAEADVVDDLDLADEAIAFDLEVEASPLLEAVAQSPAASFREEAAEAAPARGNRLQASPTLGAAAIQAPQADGTAKSATRQFEERDGIHYEVGYDDQELTPVTRGSTAFDALIEAHPTAREDIERRDRIVIRLDETWYRIEPATN